jgi:PhnB protein
MCVEEWCASFSSIRLSQHEALSTTKMPNDMQRPPVKIGVPALYLRVNDAARAIQFYVDAFGATEIVRLAEPSGRVAHAEVLFGGPDGTTLMLSDEYPENGLLGPVARGGTSVAIIMSVADVDDVCARVERAGGVVRSKPALDPFGDRTAKSLIRAAMNGSSQRASNT